MSSNRAIDEEKAQLRIQAELFENGVSLGSYVTEGEDRLIIGSSKRADLVVPHESVSNIHAMLRIVGNTNLLLYDLGSEKGTFVQGKKIVEKQLQTGETFDIGSGHHVKVNILNLAKDEMGNERASFWKDDCKHSADYLEMIRLEEGIVREERTLSRNGRIYVGRRKNEIPLNEVQGGKLFLQRKDSGKSSIVECLLPPGYTAEIFDGSNDLARVVEEENAVFTFNSKEKVKLFTKDQKTETLIFWRPQGVRTQRRTSDADNPTLQRSMILCACAAAILLAFVSYVPLKKEVVEEATVPKSSYFRLSMDSAPAQEAPAAAEPAQKTSEPAPSKVSSISSTLTKMLQKKSSLSAETMKQAISQNGNVTTRVSNVTNANLKNEAIASGSIGGGTVNVNALSAGLRSGEGKAGSLKGFANGKGTAIGGGSGFGGKGFDMSLGGDEEEAIGGLDKSLIAAVVQANIGQIKHCYERQLIVDPNIFGKVVAQWTINKDGVVSVSSVKKTTMNSKPVENCILAKIKGWGFPKPKGGGQVLVSYPFLFKSLN